MSVLVLLLLFIVASIYKKNIYGSDNDSINPIVKLTKNDLDLNILDNKSR